MTLIRNTRLALVADECAIAASESIWLGNGPCVAYGWTSRVVASIVWVANNLGVLS